MNRLQTLLGLDFHAITKAFFSSVCQAKYRIQKTVPTIHTINRHLSCPRLQVLSKVVRLAEVFSEWNAVQVLAAITAGSLIDIKHQKSYHIQRDNQRKTHNNLNLLPPSVKLAKRNIGKEDEGQ